ncbi:hypothetical protein [Mesorhizobium sp. WSM3879]|uniref:hypothetical protein n=1 Tax=Mesorhizobium sp. WSM3879 TaxID=2029406 RepID=UPI0011804118|nr:hypothetical protein [Mesorhizobium sp. WSM3879]
MSKLVHNERVKLQATFFNSLGVISLSTGAIVPTISLSLAGKPLEFWTFLPFIAGAVTSVFCVIAASHIIGTLKE